MFCNKHKEIDRFPFFTGNCLPDIRYIDKNIERTKFHANNISIDDVLREESDFWKWVKFHCFLDEKRDYFYENNGIYVPKTSDMIFIYSLKVLEDDILYLKLSIRKDFIRFLMEYKFPVNDVDEKTIKKWKNILCNYFSMQPCIQSRKDFILWVGLSEELHIQIENMLDDLRCKYASQIDDMISFIESIMD